MRKYENKENKTTINGERNSIQALQYSVSSLLPLLFLWCVRNLSDVCVNAVAWCAHSKTEVKNVYSANWKLHQYRSGHAETVMRVINSI